MKKFAVTLSLVVGIWVLIPAPQAHASWLGDQWEAFVSWFQSGDRAERLSQLRERHHGHKASHRARVPELDPSAAGGAMILLLGGAAYIASRRRENDLG